jgi:ATP-binding cassette subfamily F protein 3
MLSERCGKAAQSWQMKLEFTSTPTSGRDVLVLEDLAVGYGENVLLSKINLTLRYGVRAVLIGPGAGKTTLLRTIAGQLPPLAGSAASAQASRSAMTQEQEKLDPELNLLKRFASCRQSRNQRAPFSPLPVWQG